MNLVSLTPEEGADTLIYLAASPAVEGVSGKYYIKRKAVPSSRISNDPEVAHKLWEFSQNATL